jgi:hypothetical protein
MDMKLRLYCTCGSIWKGDGIPKEAADRILNLWYEQHVGREHGACDAKTAQRARRVAESKRSDED